MKTAIMTIILASLVAIALVRLLHIDYVKKSDITAALLVVLAAGCAAQAFLNLANWRISISWLLAMCAVVVVFFNVMTNVNAYRKNNDVCDIEEELVPPEDYNDQEEVPAENTSEDKPGAVLSLYGEDNKEFYVQVLAVVALEEKEYLVVKHLDDNLNETDYISVIAKTLSADGEYSYDEVASDGLIKMYEECQKL